MHKLRWLLLSGLFVGLSACSDKEEPADTAQTCIEITEDFTMTSDEYNAFLSGSEEPTDESCNAICQATESEYDAIVDCELTGQATGTPEQPSTATVTCTYSQEPCE